MTHVGMQDPVTGVVRQPLGLVILAGIILFAALILGATIFPYYSKYYLYTSIPIGTIGFISALWLNIRPNLYARFFFNVVISILCLMMAFRSFNSLFPQFSYGGAVLMVGIVTFAHILPIWNSKATRFIRDELSMPSTKIGKIMLKAVLVLAPFAVILCMISTSILYRGNRRTVLSFILLIGGLLFAVILPFAYQFPSSPWEVKEK